MCNDARSHVTSSAHKKNSILSPWNFQQCEHFFKPKGLWTIIVRQISQNWFLSPRPWCFSSNLGSVAKTHHYDASWHDLQRLAHGNGCDVQSIIQLSHHSSNKISQCVRIYSDWCIFVELFSVWPRFFFSFKIHCSCKCLNENSAVRKNKEHVTRTHRTRKANENAKCCLQKRKSSIYKLKSVCFSFTKVM